MIFCCRLDGDMENPQIAWYYLWIFFRFQTERACDAVSSISSSVEWRKKKKKQSLDNIMNLIRRRGARVLQLINQKFSFNRNILIFFRPALTRSVYIESIAFFAPLMPHDNLILNCLNSCGVGHGPKTNNKTDQLTHTTMQYVHNEGKQQQKQ